MSKKLRSTTVRKISIATRPIKNAAISSIVAMKRSMLLRVTQSSPPRTSILADSPAIIPPDIAAAAKPSPPPPLGLAFDRPGAGRPAGLQPRLVLRQLRLQFVQHGVGIGADLADAVLPLLDHRLGRFLPKL